MNGRFYVTTSNAQRAKTWAHIFGTDTLPVRQDRPRVRETCDGAMLAFDLDARCLTDWQISRLATHIAWRTQSRHSDVMTEIRLFGWPIAAAETTVTETAVAGNRQRPFVVILKQIPPRPHHHPPRR